MSLCDGEHPFLGGTHCSSVGLLNGKGGDLRGVILQLGAVHRGFSPLIGRRSLVPSEMCPIGGIQAPRVVRLRGRRDGATFAILTVIL
jgi:hypothetical protein